MDTNHSRMARSQALSWGGEMNALPPRSVDLVSYSKDLPRVCQEYVEDHRKRFIAAIDQGECGFTSSEKFAKAIDGLLQALFCAAVSQATASQATASQATASQATASQAGGHGNVPYEALAPNEARVALVAVGSYGRRAPAVDSDIDITVLCDASSAEYASVLAEAILYPLWDAGIRVGHAVRDLGESLELIHNDVRTATIVLDARRIAGDRQLFAQWIEGARDAVFASHFENFVADLQNEVYQRHERFGDSPFVLEPEVKLGCGGLRDIDVIRWTAAAHLCRCQALESPEALLAPADKRCVDEALDFLHRVRNVLHARGGRKQDRLTFDRQEELAVYFGHHDAQTLAVERFMRTYYLHVRQIGRILHHLFDRAQANLNAQHSSRTLSEHFVEIDGCVSFGDTQLLQAEPWLALRIFQYSAKHEQRIYIEARDQIMAFCADPAWVSRLQSHPKTAELFCSLLTHAAETKVSRNSLLAQMHELGLLTAVIPEFESITGLGQHDSYHLYTVDTHSIAAVERLHALVRGDFAQEWPLSSELATDSPRPVPLYLGLLLHDVGKAHGKEHPERGAEMAKTICERLGLGEPDVEHVVWLVRHHLDLYHWATRRDLNDANVASELAKGVGSLERLSDLYLVTVADVGTTNPSAMTAWKTKLLDDAYRSLVSQLDGTSSTNSRAAVLRQKVLAQAGSAVEHTDLHNFLSSMPDRYVLANDRSGVLSHLNIAANRKRGELRVKFISQTAYHGCELVVCLDDRPGLLAYCCAALAARRWLIEAAQVYTRRVSDGTLEAFDIFNLRRANDSTQIDPDAEATAFEKTLLELMQGELEPQEIVAQTYRQPAWTRRATPQVNTRVITDNEAASDFTVIDVYTQDRPGLLYTIASVLQKLKVSIALSKVSTEGAKAADIFYVQKQGGGKIVDQEELRTIVSAIRDSLT